MQDNFEQEKMNIGEPIDHWEMDNNGSDGGEGEKGIIYKSIDEVLHESMIPYTETVVMDRALPRVEDGLKPVQRRILYSMLELGITPDKPYRKSARIVGDCLGKYHPHGDSSVYDAMTRMAQDYILRAPLVDGHGNFGSIDGDSPAAMRYTEARLTPLAMELMKDLDKDTVRWSLNFDDTLKEPDMMPGRFPNLLVNGASGIAVGVATNIPPHNLAEVIDGVVAYIDSPSIKLEQMMKIIKAPDFPTGGQIIDDGGLEQAYRTGKGKILIRSKVEVEKQGDKITLVITELPYQVNKALLLQKIAELKEQNKDKLASISEIRDESDRTGMRAVIRLKKDADVKKILEYLYKSTNLQVSYAINMVAIAGGKPKLMGLLEIISYYANYQREIIVRRTKYDLNMAKERAHIVEGLLIAIKNIDEVIKIIKKSATTSEAKQRLRDRFNLSERQAQAILDMRLARLVNLEVNKLEEELKELKAKIAEYERILASKKAQFDVVKKEILEIKRSYGNKRRSRILKDGQVVVEEAKDPNEKEGGEVVVAISAGNTIKRISPRNYSMSQKSLSDNSTITDVHSQVIKVDAKEQIFIITDKGNCVKVLAGDIKECKWRDKGVALSQIDKAVSPDEKPVKILTAKKEGAVLFMTAEGMVKKSSASDLVVSKSFYQVVKVNDGDKLINVEYVTDKPILMLSSLGMSLAFSSDEVPLQGRISAGVKGINLDEGDKVVFAGQMDFDGIVAVTDKGFIKKIKSSLFQIGSRYRKGLKYFALTGGSKEVCFACGESGGATVAVDFGLKILALESKKIPYSDRLAPGNQIIKKQFFSINKYNLA